VSTESDDVTEYLDINDANAILIPALEG